MAQQRSRIFISLPPGQPSLIKDEITTEVNIIFHNFCVNGAAITRKTVSIGNGMLISRCPEDWQRMVVT